MNNDSPLSWLGPSLATLSFLGWKGLASLPHHHHIIQTWDKLILDLIENNTSETLEDYNFKVTFQASNPTAVNVPLCLDLTLNWLLNVYDW